MNWKTILMLLLLLIPTTTIGSNKGFYKMGDNNKIKYISDFSGPLRDDESFLKTISQIESSGGKDTDHEVIQNGIQAGTSAIGNYGLMPNTIREIAKRVRLRDPRLGLAPDFEGDPTIEQYDRPEIDDQHITDEFANNPELQTRAARYLREYLKNRLGGDKEKMAYGWTMGQNLPPEKITPEALDSSPYVAKFRKLRESFSKK